MTPEFNLLKHHEGVHCLGLEARVENVRGGPENWEQALRCLLKTAEASGIAPYDLFGGPHNKAYSILGSVY